MEFPFKITKMLFQINTKICEQAQKGTKIPRVETSRTGNRADRKQARGPQGQEECGVSPVGAGFPLGRWNLLQLDGGEGCPAS